MAPVRTTTFESAIRYFLTSFGLSDQAGIVASVVAKTRDICCQVIYSLQRISVIHKTLKYVMPAKAGIQSIMCSGFPPLQE